MSSQKKTYEAMFLLDAGGPDFQEASEPIRTILQRNEAEVLSLKPWEDRRLAYEIRGRRRGLYVLGYMTCDPGNVKEIERDCQLDERILRVLILRKDKLADGEVEAETPADASARRAAEAAEVEEAAKAEEAAKTAEGEEAAQGDEDDADQEDKSSADAADERSDDESDDQNKD